MCYYTSSQSYSYSYSYSSSWSFSSSWSSSFNYFWSNFWNNDSDCDSSSDDSYDSVILTGETNTDGTGSSVNLTAAEATIALFDDGAVTQDGVTVEHATTSCGSITSTTVYSEEWDADGYKEVQIINSDDCITVENITDVNIVNTSASGSDITLTDVKRGVIETGSGDDNIDITVYSNNEHWVNTFDIDTGKGDDSVVLSDVYNSQNTSFDISLSCGNDTLDVSELVDSNCGVSRVADGGKGTDTLILNGQDSVSFSNFEVIQGGSDAGLTIDSDLLAANDSSCYGLVFNNVDLDVSSDLTVNETDELSCSESQYISSLGFDSSDYLSVTLTDDDGSSYSILTDDADFSQAC